MDNKLAEWLDQYQIKYKLHSHPAVFTIEEARKHCGHIPGLHCKNLFLKDISIIKTMFKNIIIVFNLILNQICS